MSSARAAFSRKREPNSALPASSCDDELLHLVRIDEHVARRRRRLRVREVERDPVVRPDRGDLQAEGGAQAGGERERPGRVHAAAEGREDAEPPVADLVAEALDDDRPVGRKRARRLLLLAQVREEVLGRPRVEHMLPGQPLDGLLVRERDELASGAPDRLAELVGPARALALPERHRPGDCREQARRAPGRG